MTRLLIQYISRQFASTALLLIFAVVILFHGLVLAGIIPYTVVWGGRLQNKEQMLPFEISSILLNALMITVVAIHAGYLKIKFNPNIIRVALWIMFALFLLNTIGNLFSNNDLEKIIFTPITFLLAILSLRLAID